jgi:hypothetical protein
VDLNKDTPSPAAGCARLNLCGARLTDREAHAYPVRMKLAAGVLVLCAIGSGCQRDRAAAPPVAGQERADCRPDRTCDPGLLCLSGLCVRPPPADCQAVAEQLTSLELGNYAEPEARAPISARYKASCETARVSKDEALCLDKARDRWSAGQCVPRMFPDVASTATGDCASIVARTRTLLASQAANVNDPKMKPWFERTMAVMQESCEQDHWPDQLKRCLLTSSGAADAMRACNQQMPPELQQKMQARMTRAMQTAPAQ